MTWRLSPSFEINAATSSRRSRIGLTNLGRDKAFNFLTLLSQEPAASINPVNKPALFPASSCIAEESFLSSAALNLGPISLAIPISSTSFGINAGVVMSKVIDLTPTLDNASYAK